MVVQGGILCPMSKIADAKAKIRLEMDIYNSLVLIQKNCDWPVSLGTLGNYAARHGMNKTKKTFNSPSIKTKNTK